MKYYSILYLSTFIIMAGLDSLWLMAIARSFYADRLGNLLEFHAVPAVLFYIMYIAGVLIFVSGAKTVTTWQPVMLYGALFGFFAYATYDLTNMATLRGWSVSLSIADMAWGTFNTAISATGGWFIARLLTSTQP